MNETDIKREKKRVSEMKEEMGKLWLDKINS